MKNTQVKQESKPFEMPYAQYRQMEAVSSTDLRNLAISPQHYKMYTNGQIEETDSMAFGTMFHMAILEPERFMDTYVIEPESMPDGTLAGEGEGKVSRRTKVWKDFISQWSLQNASKIQVSPDEFKMLRKMMKAVHSNRKADELIKTHQKELVGLWVDPATGLKCKARADLLGSCLIDVKSTSCESPWEFEYDCYIRRVHLQSAFYDTGFSLNGCNFESRFIIAVEKSKKKPQVGCFVMEIEDALLERGREKNKRLMDLLISCREKNHWPGYDDVYTLGIPANKLVDFEREI